MRKSPVIAVLEEKTPGPGLAGRVAALIAEQPAAFPELMFGLWHVEAYVRERAADAIEKITREQPRYLQPFKAELLGVMAEARPASVRWHLAQMVPRLKLNKKERLQAIALLRGYLEDRSSIVKTFALESLTELARPDPAMGEEMMGMILGFAKTGTPAMKARVRLLLRRLR